jgi:RNA polymerase sigma factor (TIGR02999 family)
LSSGDVTRLLSAIEQGDSDAAASLFPLVYEELRAIAHRQLGRGGAGGTLNTTAVVHEAYLKLAGHGSLGLRDRQHLFAIAARAMRQVIVDHARAHLAKKRGGGAQRTLLDESVLQVEARAAELLDLERAMQSLAAMDDRLARVVDLRFICGLSVEETAELLGVTSRTVERDWRQARAFLLHELEADRAGGGA